MSAELSQRELAAIAAQFANPPAVDDANSEMVGRMSGVEMRGPIHPSIPMPGRNGGMMPPNANGMQFVPGEAEDHVVVPQDGGVGVPAAKAFDPNSTPMIPNGPDPRMFGYPSGGQMSVYEDNGQKFVIKDGCIYKQTWTTIENGAECRMFDVRKGKKVSPKGIVIQKYDWVPLSVANAIGCTQKQRKRPAQQVPVESPTHIPAPVAAPVVPATVQNGVKPDVNPVVESDQEPVKKQDNKDTKQEKPEFKPLVKPLVKPAKNTKDAKTEKSHKKSAPKVHNAGIIKKTTEE